MNQFDVERRITPKTAHIFNILVIILLGTGLVTLYSASFSFCVRLYGNGNHLIIRQLIFAAVGIALFFVFSRIKFSLLRKLTLPLVLLTVVLCILTLIPGIGVEKYGAWRWIKIGPNTYQPSELVKFVLPLFLAHVLDKRKDNLDNFISGVMVPIIITGLFFGLIYIQNDFSTAFIIVLNAMIIFYLAGMRFRYFFAAIAMMVPISVLLVFTKEHRVKRLISFLRPEWEPLGAGFQVNASKAAIASSGFWGKGIGEGTQKIANVPEIHSDFIFSSYVEETGFLGILFFFILFSLFAFFGYRAAWKSRTFFGRLLAVGLTTMVVSQALLNAAVVSGALPATGIPLPFFSAGGSSLLTCFICAGLIANVARKNGINSEIKSLDKVSEDKDVF